LVAAWNHAARPLFCFAFDSINNQRQPHGSTPKPLKDTMHSISHPQPVKALVQSSSKKQPRKPLSVWKPQSSGLTREEIRTMIIDQIG
jgi:hypothetical protein